MRAVDFLRIRVPLLMFGLGLSGCPSDDDPVEDTDDTDVGAVDSAGDSSVDEETDTLPVDTDVEVEVQPPTGRVTHLSINGGDSTASLAPEADVELVVDFEIANDVTCSSCPAQVVIGLDGEALGCVYDDVPGVATVTGQGSLDLVAPLTPGTFVVQYAIFNAATCDAAKVGFERLTLDDDDTIGSIEVFESSGAGVVDSFDTTTPIYTSGGSCTTVNCPTGKTLLSMGITFPSPPDNDDEHMYYHPLDADTAKFCYESDNAVLQVTCGTATSTRIVTQTGSLAPVSGSYGNLTVEATCSPGETMLGGYGGKAPEFTTSLLIAPRSILRVGQTAQAQSRILPFEFWGGSGPGAIPQGVTAVCSSAKTTQTATASVALAAPGDACATATCPVGMLALGGGYAVSGTLNDNPQYRSVYVNRRDTPDTWKVCYNNSQTTGGTLTAEAYCAVNR